jgi:tetratricopeptide (TPR) repeat protein
VGKKSRQKRERTATAAAEPAPLPAPSFPRPHLGAIALIVVVTFATFLPVLQNGFVNWDDDPNLVQNPDYRGLGPRHLAWMFTTGLKGHYQPLSWVTLGADYVLWGMNARGYHLTSLLIHAANAALFYVLLLHLLGHRPRVRLAAAGAAVLFALHPLRVESVAWATERRDVVATFFALLSVIAYLRMSADGPQARRAWKWSIAFFYLSLFSKAWAITLPVVLLVIDAYPLRRLTRETIRDRVAEKLPYFAGSAVFSVIAAIAQREAAAMRSWSEHTFVDRTMQAAYGLVFYVWKTIVPLDLLPLYELEKKLDAGAPEYVLSLLAVLAVVTLLIRQRRRWPWLLAAFVSYAILISPVLGFAQSGPQKVKDSYAYLACLPFAALAAGAILRSRLVAPALAVVATIFAVLSFRQCQVWKDSITLWTHTIALAPRSFIAQTSLAAALEERKDVQAAMRHYRLAVEARRDEPRPRHGLALMLVQVGNYPAAIEEWKALLRHAAKREAGRNYAAEANFCLGLAHVRIGRPADGIVYYREAIAYEPGYKQAYESMAEALLLEGRTQEAEEANRATRSLKHVYAHPTPTTSDSPNQAGRRRQGP